jgi:hypothetical protein
MFLLLLVEVAAEQETLGTALVLMEVLEAALAV